MSIALLLFTSRCLDPYASPGSKHDIRNLVVDGFLNGTDGTCSIRLSRTMPLGGFETPPAESGATVWLVDENDLTFQLSETEAGLYTVNNLAFSEGHKIRLKIVASDHTEFESDMVSMLKTPAIDSVTWTNARAGVQIYMNAHNNNEVNRYYFWKFSETWSYHARYLTVYTLDADHNVVPLTEQIYECWSTAFSTGISIGTSSLLETNTGILSQFPLTIVPWESPKLQRRYSILVEQRSISQETYEYLEELKKNTENLGTLFDPLPSAPAGNIKCVTYPAEMVQGKFTASTVEQKRIFFNSYDLDRPTGTASLTGYEDCNLFEIRRASDWDHFFPVTGPSGSLMGTTRFCVDCRFNGGTNVQPDFW